MRLYRAICQCLEAWADATKAQGYEEAFDKVDWEADTD